MKLQSFGVFGGEDVDPQFACRLGAAVAARFKKQNTSSHIVVGRDTRTSSDMLFAAVCSGICSQGVDVVDVGVVPSAAVSFCTKKYSAIAGIMITIPLGAANSNGFVIFDAKGFAVGKKQQNAIEKLIEAKLDFCNNGGKIFYEHKAKQDYIDFLKQIANFDLSGLVVLMDLCHGCAADIAPLLFENNEASVCAYNAFPDGQQINVACGLGDTLRFGGAVVRSGADMGFVFDADAGSVVAIDEKGSVVDGDKILYLFACFLHENDRLLKNVVVGTKFSSLALENALGNLGVQLLRCNEGEPTIVAKMNAGGFMLGGEKYGKIVLRDFLPTSDGILVALFVAKIVKQKGKKLSELVSFVKDLPREEKRYIMNCKQQNMLRKSKDFAKLLDFVGQKQTQVQILQSKSSDCLQIVVESKNKHLASKAMKQIDKFISKFAKEV